MIWVALLIVLMGIAAWPFAVDARKPAHAAELRPLGQVAQLSQARTWYRWSGPTRGPVVVLIHGLTTPSPVFDDLGAELVKTGARTLVYDLYGRGLSDAVLGPQNAAFFLRQLDDLLRDQVPDGPLTLVGYSMGAQIAAIYAAQHPQRVTRLVLLAPAGMYLTLQPFWRRARDLPVLGDWMARAFGARALRQVAASGTRMGQVQTDQLDRRGYLPAVLSSLRGLLGTTQESVHRSLATQGLPVLAIWGGQDGTIPQTAPGRLAQWNRNATQEVIVEADHGLPWRHADRVAELMRRHAADLPV
ncbi:alpha/beta fold hydrolase [Loktanella sp. SALINAS62]|uniref:alpha/beta fold hydrolase n=1 Tax=Loktanella sp. SALINAS62 TaxID=2706124 RepID=UPI001B8C185F|nr:alpha/beta fold hydrolase [Loktanella sp. SALINAS62]MBS1302105.1 alpha/beta hydrolase [Loktanella sp. SALINAS62]